MTVATQAKCECPQCSQPIPPNNVRRQMVPEREGMEPTLVQVDAWCEACNVIARVICSTSGGQLSPLGATTFVTDSHERSVFFLATMHQRRELQVA